MPKPLTKVSDVTAYSALVRRVKETLLDGQRRIEAEKIRTYWDTGRLIQTHILHNQERAEYGAEVIVRLAGDLKVDPQILKRCRRFFQRYQKGLIGTAPSQLGWGKYLELIDVSDDKERAALEQAIIKGHLTIEEIRARKRDLRQSGITDAGDEEETTVPQRGEDKPLTPVQGQLYTYQIIPRRILGSRSAGGLVIDLGFSVTHEPDARLLSAFSGGDIIESKPKDDAYRFARTERTDKDLFTYQGFIERVIDGDTLKVHIDLGFGMWIKETLRLRGIDCPEVKTTSGDAAKAYVQSLLKEADEITLRTFKPDKYDRYLADVFLPAGGQEGGGVYLNNLLLEKGHAGRWQN